MTEEQFWSCTPKKLQALFKIYKQVNGIEEAEAYDTIDNILFQIGEAGAGNDKYYEYRYEGKINDLKNAVNFICWSKTDISDKASYIISTDVNLDSKAILEYYKNLWDIEVS